MNLETWRWFLSNLKPHTRHIVLILIVSGLYGLMGVVSPLVLQRLVDAAVAGVYDATLVTLLICLFVAESVPLQSWMRGRLRARFAYTLRGNLQSSLLRMDMAFHDDRGSTTLTTQAAKGVGAASSLLNLFTSSRLLLQLPVALYAVYYLGQHSVIAVCLLVGFLGVFSVCTKVLGAKIAQVEEVYQEIDTELTDRSREAVHQIQTVKLNNAVGKELAYYWQEGARALVQRFRLNDLYSVFGFLGGGAHNFATALSVVFFVPQLVRGEITVGTFFALAMFASRIVGPAEYFGNFYTEIKEASALLRPVMEILANKPTVVEQQHPLRLNPVRDAIEMRHLSFCYPGSDRLVLDNVSITFPAGKKTAIVGRTGSGKTTLARLLTRLYDPTEGVIAYDGTDLRNVSLASLYGEVAYVTQEVPVFSGTIARNVAYGIDGCQHADVVDALTRASAVFVHQLEDGVDTKVGELGKKLSGGERQRLAIARLFMRNPSVVILDEATSALDNVTEWAVHRALEELGARDGGKTMVVIAHRLSTVRDADQIVVMDGGKVLDTGKHDELLARCEFYRVLNTTLTET